MALLLLVAIPITGSVAAISLHNATRLAEVHAIATTSSTSSASAGRAYFTTNTQWATAAQNARLSAISTLAANGYLAYYSGSQPANGNASITGTLLCVIKLGATPFNAPSSGTMTNNGAITCTGTSGATGTGTAAGYAILFKSDSSSVIGMTNVGTSSSGIVLPSTTITTGESVSIPSGSMTITDNASS
jgi:hypothetical protein